MNAGDRALLPVLVAFAATIAERKLAAGEITPEHVRNVHKNTREEELTFLVRILENSAKKINRESLLAPILREILEERVKASGPVN